MNDDLTSELLASAYVDHDVTPAQAAEVEASPELMALVASYRSLRTSLGDVSAAPATDREQAISAALAEFDRLTADQLRSGAPRPAPVPAPVVSLDSRRRWSRVLSAAAAIVVVGVVGIAINQGMHGSDSKSSSMAPPVEANSTSRITTEPAGKDAGQPATAPTIGSIDGAAQTTPELDQPAQLLTVTDQYAATDVGVSSGGGGQAPNTAVPTAALRPTLSCPTLGANASVLSEIRWRGTRAFAVRDTVSGVVQAVDLQCNVLARATP